MTQTFPCDSVDPLKEQQAILRRHSASACGLSVWVSCRLLLLVGILSVGLSSGNSNTQSPFDRTEKSAAEVNAILGVELFSDMVLWEEDSQDVAKRLGWPLESQTNRLASYRFYPTEAKNLQIGGAKVASAALYAVEGKPVEISIIFANKGDLFSLGSDAPDGAGRGRRVETTRDVLRILDESIKRDQDQLLSVLESAFGKYGAKMNFGGSRNTRESVYPWRWRGHGIILAVEEREYVALRFIRPYVLDARGRSTRSDDPDLRQRLRDEIQRRQNGDVILTQVPMVDQGPKGYCVPATYERVLRYVGIQADMYALAMAGGTQLGGGTYLGAIENGVRSLVNLNGRRFYDIRGKFTFEKIREIIDEGLPILWGVSVYEALEKQWLKRMKVRTDPQRWHEHTAALAEIRSQKRPDYGQDTGKHLRLIIGYNPQTREIAISDSWGKIFAERWITEEEFSAVSFGEPKVIRW